MKEVSTVRRGTGISSAAALGVEIVPFNPAEWRTFEAQLMRLEDRCFPPVLRLDAEDKKEATTRNGAIVLLAKSNGKVIGEAYGFPLDSMDEPNDPHDRERAAFIELAERHRDMGNRVFYNYSIAVLPEHQGRGTGTRLKSKLIAFARASGYALLADHAREGPSVDIDKRLGASMIKGYQDWYGSGKTHFLCEIKLR